MPISELQAMRHHAELSGVATSDLDAGMTRFTKRLGVLQTTGSGMMAGISKKISPKFLESLKGAKTNIEAYKILLKQMEKLPTQQQKMALADAAFGMSGRKMLVMLNEGTEGLIKSRKELASLGGLADKKDTQAAEDYNDTMLRMKTALESVKLKAFTPILKEATVLIVLRRFALLYYHLSLCLFHLLCSLVCLQIFSVRFAQKVLNLKPH